MYPFKCTKVIFTCDVRTEHVTILLGCVSLNVEWGFKKPDL